MPCHLWTHAKDFENTRNKPLIPPVTVQHVPKIPHQDGLSGVNL